MCGESGVLVKTFTAWQKLASLENTGGGTGGYSFPRITAVSVALYFCENNGASAGQRRHFLTAHIKNVIISVATITKMLFVTRAPNLRCKAFYGVSL